MTRELSIGTSVAGRCGAGTAGRRVGLPLDAVATGSGLIAGDAAANGAGSAARLVAGLLEHGIGCLVVDAGETLFGRLPAAFERWSHQDGGSDVVGRRVTNAVTRGKSTLLDLSDLREPGGHLDTAARALADAVRDADRRWILVVSSLERYVPTAGDSTAAGETIGRLAAGGDSREVGLLATTAAPAAVDSAVLEACEWRLWHRLSATEDRSLVRCLVNGEHARAVRDLSVGEAILETGWQDATERVAVEKPGANMTENAHDVLEGLSEDVTEVIERLDRIEAALESDGTIDEASNDGSIAPQKGNTAPPSSQSNGHDESSAVDAMGGDDALTALAGIGTEDGTGETVQSSSEDSRLVGDGGPDLGSVSDELHAFESGVDGVVPKPAYTTDRPSVAVGLESTLDELDPTSLAQLRTYRSDGPLEPVTAYKRAIGREDRVAAYTANRRLRRTGLIEHVGRGRYRYALEARVAAGLPGDRADRAAAIVSDLEAAHLD